MVVNAPKGTTKFQYIPAGNANSILSQFGQPSSSWPDLQELIDFNANYGVWVSAPGGSYTAVGAIANSAYNLQTYFGGCYLTTLGSFEPFYNVPEDASTGLPAFNYQILVSAGSTSPYAVGMVSTLSGAGPYTSLTQLPSNSTIASNVVGFLLRFTRGDGSSGSITFNRVGSNLTVVNPSTGLTLSTGVGSISGTGVSLVNNTNYLFIDPVTQINYADLTFPGSSGTWTGVSLTNIQNISTQTISAVYQTSPRQTTGTFLVNNVDLRALQYDTYTYTWSLGATPTGAGIINICGANFSFTTGSSIATQIQAFITATSSTTMLNGYTIAVNASTVTISQNGRSSATPVMYIPSTGGVSVSGTLATVVVNGTTYNIPSTTSPTSSGNGTGVSNPTYNTYNFTYNETSYGSYQYTLSATVSTNPVAVDSKGNDIYSDDYLASNSFIQSTTFQNMATVAGGVTWQTPLVTFGGQRANLSSQYVNTTTNPMKSVFMQSGWNVANDPLLTGVDIFIEPGNDPLLVSNLSTLRLGAYPFATFITGILSNVASPSSPTGMTAVINDISRIRSTYPNVTGLAYYVNPMYIRETYSGTSYWNIPTGSIASMLAYDMDQWNGGLAPMWINENNVGGQINNSKVKKQKYKFQATDLDTLDTIGVNPIILDSALGLIITSQRTAQSPINLTDYSYLGHQMSFDSFKVQIQQNVMLPQIGKFIDGPHMQNAKDKCNFYLNQRLTGPGAIWSAGIVLVQEVNTPATLAANTFMITIRVKVYPYSEYVVLNFVNKSQTSTVN